MVTLDTPPAMALPTTATVDREVLSTALGLVTRAVGRRDTLPILNCVLLEAVPGLGLRLLAADLDVAIGTQIPADAEGQWAIALYAQLLTDYLGEIDGAAVDLAYSEQPHQVTLQCGRYTAHVHGLDAEDMPPVPEPGADALTLTLPSDQLKDALRSVVFAAAKDANRPVLAGVLFGAAEGRLTLAAADGFRLAVVALDAPGAGSPPVRVIVPRNACQHLAHLLPESPEPVLCELPITQGQPVRFSVGATQVTSRVLQGEFPDYTKMIPTEATTAVTVSRKDLLCVVKAAAVFARDNSNIVRLTVAPHEETAAGRDEVQVSSGSMNGGDSDGQVVAEVAGPPQRITLNSRWLRDALESLDTTQVMLDLVNPQKPVVLRPVGGAADLLQVIMPMRANGR